MIKLLFVIPVIIACLAVNAQTNLYVATDGNNRNNGSIQKPYKTLRYALAQACSRQGGVAVIMRGGTYYLDTTIVINAVNNKASSLTIHAFNNEIVNISAGRRLQLQWQPYRNGIYKAVVPKGIYFERLYINGRLRVLARYPNYDSTARVFNGTAGDAIDASRASRWHNPVGGYVHALHEYEWGGFHYRITGVDAGGKLQLQGGWQNNRPAGLHKEYRFVENIFEELDTPGEWWLNRDSGILYYYPLKGEKLANAVIEVSHLRNSILLQGSEDKPLRNVYISGLHFIHNERSFMETKEPLLRSDWTIYRGGALLLQGTEDCSIKNCYFTYNGGNAIMVSSYNRHDTISGCYVANAGASGIAFVGDTKAARSPLYKYDGFIPYNRLDTTLGPLTHNYPQECAAINNLIHNIGEIEKQATGVEIEVASRITVSHNTIYNTPRAGINIGDGCFGGHTLSYNDVFNTVLETGDHGAFNSWGRDRYWNADRHYMDSLVAAHPSLIKLDAQEATNICNNRFRCDHGWDIDLDDGSTNYHIYNNVCLNGGLKLREGFYRVVQNNILINNSFHPHVWFVNSGDVFEHNIVMRPYAPIGITGWGNMVDNNLFADSTSLLAAQANGTDKSSIAGDAMFKNPSTGDYTVANNSPAFNVGFANFSMDSFGVQSPVLRQMAARVDLPVLVSNAMLSNPSAIIGFLGGKIKSVEGLGDRSAYGLPDETGVVIIEAGDNSLLSKAGLHNKDVIRGAGGKLVKNVQQLLDVYQSLNWTGKLALTIISNQQMMDVEVKTK